jgi:hypothetical protein
VRDGFFVYFKTWLGTHYFELKSMACETISAGTIEQALVLFEKLFSEKSFQ